MFRLSICLLLAGAEAMRSFEEFELAFGKKYSTRERIVRRARQRHRVRGQKSRWLWQLLDVLDDRRARESSGS